MRRIEIAKILRNESNLLAKYFLSNPSEISNFNTCPHLVTPLPVLYINVSRFLLRDGNIDFRGRLIDTDGQKICVKLPILAFSSLYLCMYDNQQNRFDYGPWERTHDRNTCGSILLSFSIEMTMPVVRPWQLMLQYHMTLMKKYFWTSHRGPYSLLTLHNLDKRHCDMCDGLTHSIISKDE